VAKWKTCPHCGSRYRLAPARKPRRQPPAPADDMSPQIFRALSWVWFWDAAGRPPWRAASFGLEYGDGMMAEDVSY